ncbi:hypothetical protein [Streptomyces sp. Da 82-17]|uniref:hypothetical protein n=1 Tax=Streptomyces sp. Da 82-17 TaxID=3377116 RepID=UPI0038D4F8F5
MSNPQSPSERRDGRSAATPLEQAKNKAGMDRRAPGGTEHAHGTDKGRKGGGEGGGVPPDQQPDHPE